MYMTSTLPLFTGDSVLTTPSTQETVKQTQSDYDQSGMSGFHVYVFTTIIQGTLCMYTILLITLCMFIIYAQTRLRVRSYNVSICVVCY